MNRIYSGFSLVENRALLEDRRTADAIQWQGNQPFQNYQQTIDVLCFV